MIKRNPFECGVFKDIEAVKRYNRETEKWIRNISKSFVSLAGKWGIAYGNVLDAGTGTGLLAIELAKRIPGIEVVGLDLSDVVFKLVRENAQKGEVPSRVSFERGDAEEMPFADSTFARAGSKCSMKFIGFSSPRAGSSSAISEDPWWASFQNTSELHTHRER